MEYKITQVVPYTYLDRLSRPVNGYQVTFELIKSGEVHQIYVPKMDAELIKAEIKKFTDERQKLDGTLK